MLWNLVGGFNMFNSFENYARQIGSSPQVRNENRKIFEPSGNHYLEISQRLWRPKPHLQDHQNPAVEIQAFCSIRSRFRKHSLRFLRPMAPKSKLEKQV